MMAPSSAEARVLVVAPTGRDAPLAVEVLQRFGIPAEVVGETALLREQLKVGASAILIAEEAFHPELLRSLQEFVRTQPVWSDLPILVFTSARAENDQRLDLLREALGNVTFLERPLRAVTLVTAVRSALRARGRQYELRALLEKREDDIRQRDNFLAMLGHELRNPLATITLAIDLMDRSKLDTFARQRSLIGRQAKHLGQLVDDLLDVARITTGKIVLRRQRIELNEIARRGLLAAENALQRHMLTATLREEVPSLLVDGDPVRVEQIFSNLLTNAIKYTPSGGSLAVVIGRDGVQGLLRIRDTGVGIAPKMLQRVFELFSQADRTLDRSQGGLGIGLSVTRRLVELHGGTIEAVSAGLGHGSEFVVRLPLLLEELPAEDQAAQLEAQRARKIVIVEDQEDFREVFQSALESLGHQVQAASDGTTGLDLLLQSRPEIGFVDIGLPGLDGYEIARRVRAADEAITLVAMTGYGQPDDRQRAMDAGFDHHLTKPVDMKIIQEFLAHPV